MTMGKMTQDERLDYLLRFFLDESMAYDEAEIPDDASEKRDVLRALMNARPPYPVDEEVLAIQDEYLRKRSIEKGVVFLSQIPTIAELGSQHMHADEISIWQGDITCLAIDAIVNAANAQMLGCFTPLHGCIDNYIHTFAGVQLRRECSRRMEELRVIHGPGYEQPTAVPMITDAYNLPARKVIHVVGPIVYPVLSAEHEQQLHDCSTRCLDLCTSEGIRSIAFCCISTGVFRFPRQRAATIAIEAVTTWLSDHQGRKERVVFNVFKDEDRTHYERALL